MGSKMRLLFLLGWIFVLFPGDISSTLHFPVSRNYERQGGNDYGIQGGNDYGRQGDNDYGSQGDNDYGSQGDNDYGLSNTDNDYARQGDNDYGSQGNDDYVRIIYDDFERQGGNDYGISKTDKARRPLTFEEAGRQQHGDTDYGSQGDNDYARQGDNDYNKLIENFKGGCMTRCKKSELIKGIQSLLQSLKIKKSAIKEATDVACIEICKPN